MRLAFHARTVLQLDAAAARAQGIRLRLGLRRWTIRNFVTRSLCTVFASADSDAFSIISMAMESIRWHALESRILKGVGVMVCLGRPGWVGDLLVTCVFRPDSIPCLSDSSIHHSPNSRHAKV